MKSRILSAIAVVALIMFVALCIYAMVAYPAHLGEPSYYHEARVDCLMAAVYCGFISFVSALASVDFN